MKSKKPGKSRKTQGKVLLRDMTDGESYGYAPNPGSLYLYTYGRGKDKTVTIAGDPNGLRYLSRLLAEVADIDQKKIPDRNCPPRIGTHYHFDVRNGLEPESCHLVTQRLDAKGDGSQDWAFPKRVK